MSSDETTSDESQLAGEELARKKRELLRKLLVQDSVDPARLPIIPRKPHTALLPLSFAQEELWLIDQIDPGTIAFNIVSPPLRLEGRLNAAVLERALNEVVRRHEALRTTIQTRDGQPTQVVADNLTLPLPIVDLESLPPSEQDEELQRLIVRDIDMPFDLSHGPLIRMTLLRLDASTHLLLLALHHIIFDAISIGLFFRELATLYEAFSSGRPSPLADIPVQYADFALWQREVYKGGGLHKQLAFWKQRLQNLPELRLPMNRARPMVSSYRAYRESLILPPESVEGLKDFNRRAGVTMFITLLAAFKVLLHRYSNQDDVVVGSPVTTRRRPELDGMFGFFVNMVVMRSDLSGDPTFRELIGRVRETTLRALDNSDVPFDQVVREIGIRRSEIRNPLFQVAFAYESRAAEARKFHDLTLTPMRQEGTLTRFDIEAYARDENYGFCIEFLGASDLFDRSTLQRMLVHFRMLLEGLVADPDRPISALSLLAPVELQEVLIDGNRTDRPYPRDACVHELFELQAKRAPDAIAVEYPGGVLSYAELNARANRLARHLRGMGVGPDVLVGLSMERSSSVPVAMLGILKAGGAYVPMDTEYPAERLAFMLQDTDAPVVVTQQKFAAGFSGSGVRVVCLDTDWPTIENENAEDLPNIASADNLAYVIYTSGSTGTPKGVQVVHRGINRLVSNTDYVDIEPSDRFAQVSVISFDAATFEIWGALLNGARIVGVPKEVSLSPREFAEFMRRQGVTVLFLTTALFNQMAREAQGAFRTLRYVLFGGEAVDPDAVRAVLRDGPPQHLLHVYGPTEVTTFSTWHPILEVEEGASTVPIGHPIANTTAYVLDEQQRPVPVGIVGELYLGGDGLARGYLKRPELTAKHFVPNPFGAEPGSRLYRTGDWVRHREDGVIEFVGRRDGQVKVRGFRIELGEIEAALSRLPEVKDAVVIAREDEPGDRRVVAYVVAAAGYEDAIGGLRNTLRQHMPDYMVPSAFVAMDKFPLNANGKVDRRALPPPQTVVQVEQVIVPPRSEMEQRIAKIWQEMLRLDKVGIKDNFFDLGGHSLLLVKTHSRLTAELGCDLTVLDMFEYPTIEALAKHLSVETPVDTLAEQAQTRVNRRRGSSGAAQPIAIIGMAGRFPGAGDIESFWSNLCQGKEAITFFTREEMRESGVPEATINDPNYVGARGYLADADKFDAAFFGYSAREAEIMDPQQRLLLECASELFDRAGYDPERYPGMIGVYAGSSMNTYLASLQAQYDISSLVSGLSRVLGSAQDFLTTRVSYKLNLRGPSVNVQTACSTSLVAIHHACRALQDYECDMALAGGASVTFPLKLGHIYVQEGIGSPDGHCRAFDANASGTVGGNGVALVMLKRLDEALADGDRIHAVVRGSAINNDGSSKVGYTAPSVEGQAEAIALAQAAAQCEPDTIDYVEAHGTGTLLGDPIEVSALTRVFGNGQHRQGPCWLTSLKTSTGHLDAAAGVAGFIKAALSLDHKKIVPSLNFSQPNPQIDFKSGPFKVNTELRVWESSQGRPRRAGISAFGLGGTNAHAVLEEAPEIEPSGPSREWKLLCLSAKNASALQQATTNLAHFLGQHPETNLADAAYTLQIGRREFPHRRFIVCREVADAVTSLQTLPPERAASDVQKSDSQEVVFMFSGQGTQYPDMARGLYRTERTFSEAIDACCAKLQSHLGLDLRSVLYPEAGAVEQAAAQLRRTELTQPALFVIEYALAQLWMSFGIKPAAMIGHSIGEYVAACLAGVMSLDDALDLVAQRGRLMGGLPPGAMLSVPLPESEVKPLLGDRLSIATINSPSMCVVAGPEAEIASFEMALAGKGLAPRRLHTSHAFHSFMMDPILEPFTACVRAIKLNAPELPYISNVTGTWITAEQATDPNYYATHLRHAVQFANGLGQLFAEPNRIFLEVGPGHTLTTLAKRHPARNESHQCIACVRHPDEPRADEAYFMESIGRLWLAGARPDWSAMCAGQHRHRVLLPTYPFESKRYWLEAGKLRPGAERIRRKADPSEWTYVPSWRRVPAPTGRSAQPAGRWLCFRDQSHLCAHIETALMENGSSVVSVAAGERFEKLADGRYVLNPAVREDYDLLVAELVALSALPDYVLHLWLVAPDGELRTDEAGLAEVQDRGFFSLIFLVQAFDTQGLTAPLRLAVLTSQAQDVSGGELVSPEKAMALGPCEVIGMEYPNIRARSIDIKLDGDLKGLGRALASDLLGPWSDPVVAYRGQYRWVQAFEQIRLAVPSSPPALLREGGVYLITGGLGGLGLHLADYLGRMVHAKLVLVGRSPFPEKDGWASWLAEHGEEDATSRKIRRIQAIEKEGAVVLICQADVADELQMAAVIARAETHFGALCGVMHAAGAEKRGVPIRSLQRRDCDTQFRPKQQGLRVLEQLLRDKCLDFCLVHSSLASVMGVMGFVTYVASHLYLDAFVMRHNRAAGTPWTTINWDNWGFGRAREETFAAGPTGFYMMPDEGSNVLSRVLSAPALTQILVSTGDIQARIEQWVKREAVPDEEGQKAEDEPVLHAHPRPALSTEYVAPRNEVERVLADIWKKMLGIGQVGIHDNFFELGGDSVVNIQITARANQAGIKVTPKQVFEHQTIAELGAIAGVEKAAAAAEPDAAEPDAVAGPVPMTPIQHWFFERNLPHPQHFNLPILLETRQPLDIAILRQAMQRLEKHHDALRLRYAKEGKRWTQYLVEPGQEIPVHRFDFAGLDSDEQVRQIEVSAAELQGRLDLCNGPVLRVGYYDLGPERTGRLLLMIHHLVVDAISWRILIEDIQWLYEAMSRGQEAQLPARTVSIKRWSERLMEYAQTAAAEDELDFWRTAVSGVTSSLPLDLEEGGNSEASAARVNEMLTAEETRALLTDLPRTFNTQINDALMLALLQTMSNWTGYRTLSVDLEGHGREAILEGIDPSRTVGWFTTLYPVSLELPDAASTGACLDAVKQQLRAMPHHGMGFGLLRYLNRNPHVAAALESRQQPEISFLYMGQFDQTFSGDALFVPAAESIGHLHDPEGERPHLLEINCLIKNGQLCMSWTYSRNRHRLETVRSLAQSYMDALRSMIAHAQSTVSVTPAAPAFSGLELSVDDIAEIMRQQGMEAKGIV